MQNRALAAFLLFVLGVANFLFSQRPIQYKTIPRNAMALVAQGKLGEAEEQFRELLRTFPGDLEAQYGLAVVYALRGVTDSAVAFAQQAVEAGLPPERFVVGPRELLAPLLEIPELQEYLRIRCSMLAHGPMLGRVTDSSACFWVRSLRETSVRVDVSGDSSFTSIVASAEGMTSSDRDYTTVVCVEGLKPNTRYFYRLWLEGQLVNSVWQFRTFPARGRPALFRVAFGGGAGYTPWHERMWDTIRRFQPLAFLFLGDNVYIDHPTMPAVQRYCYYRRQSRPEYRRFVAGTAVFAIWDDHDFCTNDGWGGPDVDRPPWKRQVWRVFQENWVNPAYGGGEAYPGCWFRFSIADVDFFMLDCRYYRTDPKGPHPTMLGRRQKQWLLDALAHSSATFKVIASSVPWAFGTKPGSLDTWEGYREEREEIFSFIERNRIEGVILLSADRHRSDVWKIERPGGYDLFEFESSKLTNVHTHRLMPGALFGYNEKCSFGLLDFDTTSSDPSVTYRIVNIDGEVVHEFTVRRSQLSFPD